MKQKAVVSVHLDPVDPRVKALAESDPRLKQRLIDYENFRCEYEQLKDQYSISKSTENLTIGIHHLSKNLNHHQFNHFLIFLGDEYMESGDFEAGAACLKSVAAHFQGIYHYAIIYLRMAQYHIEKGEIEIGIRYLVQLCTEVKDYRNQITLNELTEVWERYKHLLIDRIPGLDVTEKLEPLTIVRAPQPLTPDKCSQSIDQILCMPKSDLLSALSAHIREMTANGAYLNYLNKWERDFYYADEVCMEVNSGGFEGYLYYHGIHFSKACQAFGRIGAERMLQLMNRIQCKFPRNCVPKAENAIQNAMDRMDEDGIDFNDEDEIYYSSAEKELLNRLLIYVKENEKHFR